VALWRFGSSWSDATLRARLNELSRLKVNFDLPPEQIATEHGWTAEEFLAQTCVKAGLPRDAWQRGAVVYRFSAEVFGDHDPHP